MSDLDKAVEVVLAVGIAATVTIHELEHPADNPHADAETRAPIEGLVGHAALEAVVSGEAIQSRSATPAPTTTEAAPQE